MVPLIVKLDSQTETVRVEGLTVVLDDTTHGGNIIIWCPLHRQAGPSNGAS